MSTHQINMSTKIRLVKIDVVFIINYMFYFLFQPMSTPQMDMSTKIRLVKIDVAFVINCNTNYKTARSFDHSDTENPPLKVNRLLVELGHSS